jgi:hypothetical protein
MIGGQISNEKPGVPIESQCASGRMDSIANFYSHSQAVLCCLLVCFAQ